MDAQALRYLRATNRGDLIGLVERYTKAQGLFRVDGAPVPAFDEQMDLDLATIRQDSLVRTREAMRAGMTQDLATHLDLEGRFMNELGASDDYREGVAAFTEKRPARFTGR